MRRLKHIRWIAAVLVAAAVVVAFRTLPLVEWLTATREWIAAQGPQGAALYPLMVAGCNLLLLPGGILSVGAGFFYGLWWGFLLVLTGNVLGAALALLIGRAVGRKRLNALLQRYPKWTALDAALEREGWKVILLSQLNPLFPTSLINYLYGLTRMRLLPCVGWVALGQMPGLFLYAYLGTLGQHGLNLLSGRSHPRWWEYCIWIGGFAVVVATTWMLGRLALRMLKEVAEAENPKVESAGEFDTSVADASVKGRFVLPSSAKE